ncbi:TonB-dependent receptor [Bacteroides ovatus]|uniref:TonB-dependent receptor n=1 Tax=Bacteroides ovatus TaxID=28116 RepID=A0A5M5DCM5_BACOV|nr:TonB-dependent receptor [Bacteroides ovatus]KAA4012333.1 TonB-dependent receptor [Bacteroides ovatus]KAA4012580.1 TonB-dependent receptor [Bacteroides ovatus]KAA4020236.1 TonB-dependent receptor [Bacteroides ovatus]KAA4033756.1 TonB-dependent receptor [Bacteroides ovatus]KAA4034622.1 TonB-dependent receptor [Bacteroides ovatus]
MKKSLRLKALLTLLVGLFLSIGAFAQQIAVKGHVKDTTGEPVIGANVLVKGTTNGTITDFDGNFMLNVPKDAILSVSFVGYKSAEVKAASTVMVTLEDDSQVLDAVVVIGYGSVKKNDMTGSVTAIKPDKLNKGLITNAQDMMTGKIAGVSVISKGGAPGEGATIRIRGGSSLTAENDPLIVIDGLAMDNKGVKGLANPLSMVNPNDIESFTVLKDASATAIYGSRASNGVIIITTKKGQAGARPTISYDGNVSVSTVKSTVDVMDGDQFRSFIKDIWGEDSEAYSKLGNANTDWQKEIFRPAVSTDHNLTISGGLKNMPYRVSFGYTNQNGIVKTSKFERYTASVSLAPSFFEDHLKINANLKGMIAKNRYADGGAVGSAVSFDPTQSVRSDDPYHQYYFDGYFQWNTDASSLNDDTWKRTFNGNAPGNPVALLEEKDDRAISKSLIGNLELDYKFHFLPDLHAHVNGGMDLSTGKQYTDVSPYSSTNNYYGSYGWEQKDKYNLSLNAYLQYSKDFTDKHRFDVMAGYEWQHFHDTSDQEYWGLYPLSNNVVENRGQRYNNTSSGSATESYLVSFFGRVNYTLLDRYLFTATVRQDGSSRFHKNNRWGLFPSFALGWKLKEEAFLKDVDVLSDLKLRLGYGITGQQNINSGDYPYLAVYETNKDGAYYPILGEGITYRPNAYNPDLKWEKTTTYNVGLDFGFLNNRINGAVDYYYRKTTDLLNSVFVSAGTNFKNKVLSNVGSLENSGIEFSINSKPVVTTDWTWDLGFNITYNKNEITKLTTGDSENYYVAAGDNIGGGRDMKAMAHAVGHPASSFYVYQQVYDENGKPIENEFVDRNGDGTINGDDRYFYKKPTADVLMGLTSRLSYKSWDFSFSLRASLNNYVYNSVEAGGSDCNPTSVYSFGALNNRPLMGVANNIQNLKDNTLLSDYFVQNASFMKCDNITLGYSFKKLFGAPIGGRVYAAVQNVFTITKYKGLDPEVEKGLDNNIYPRPLTTLIGLSLNF